MSIKPKKRIYFKAIVKKILKRYITKVDANERVDFKKSIKTPIGEVKFGQNQLQKLQEKKRERYIPLIQSTLKNPLFIVKDKNGGMLFVKSFLLDKEIYFTSVVVDIEDENVVISSHQVKLNKVVNRIYEKGEIISPADSFSAVSAFSEPQHEATLSLGADAILSRNILKLLEVYHKDLEFSVLKFSEVVEESVDFRLDSEFVTQKPYRNPKLLYKQIGEILQFSQYGISISMNDSKIGYPIYRMNEIHNMLCDFEVTKYAQVSETEKDTFILNDGDILFNRTNSFEFVGRTGIYYKLDKRDFIFASYLIKLVPKNIIKPEFLNVFLNTKYGIQDIKRRARISINQSNVNAEELKRIKIPIFSQKLQFQIEKLVKKTYKNLQQSKTLYTQTQQLLVEELDLKDFKLSDENVATKLLSTSFKKTGRLDSEYYQPKYDEILKKIKQYGSDKLSNLCEIKDKNFKPQNETIYKYIELSSLGNEGEVISFTTQKGKNLPSRARRKVSFNDVIVSSVEGSLDKVALVDIADDNLLCSTGFYVIQSKQINSETLLALFKNEIFQQILKQNCSGTILTAINKDEFYNLEIPLIEHQTQETIKQKIQRSFQLKKESKKLLDLAKQAVETAIEQDEEAGLKLVERYYDK